MGTPTELNQTDIDIAIDYLEGNNSLKFTPTIEGGLKFGTAPTWMSFWGYAHTDLRSDIKAVASFLSRNQYPTPKEEALQSELGSTDEVRWLTSSEAYESSGTYDNFIIGQNAYARIAVDDLSTEMIIKELGSGDDPLNQRKTMAWKSYFACVILDDGWIVNLQSTAA